ncbi:hypothetical protein EVG20_g2531 [Dentipellis fragilis]|uniref:Autophagy-related protein 17 n=1 Tax=Dentipellis fragilis TaxID=205917 RepID=A0A4Y9Z7I3_9AGAM|nr:hypothetical protein EVG20_g2531 [Dentipellis fragilis]
MSASPPVQHPGQIDIVSLAHHSEEALKRGEALCSRASTCSNASAQDAFDVLALNAKVEWISDAVVEQLKLAASVAKSIEEKRSRLEKQTQAWDTLRAQSTSALDTTLESLGSQVVPPDFHDTLSDSSLFGSQPSDSEPEVPRKTATALSQSQSAASLNGNGRHKNKKDRSRKQDRRRWKTLRDFADERAIEDALETIEDDRAVLEDIMNTTADYPTTLHNTLTAIRDGLPRVDEQVSIERVLTDQERVSGTMAEQLESLAEHYDKMENACKEHEHGEAFVEEDLLEMNRDTDELPAIISELEDSCAIIERNQDELLGAKRVSQEKLQVLHTTMDDLEELGDIMGEMLEQQQNVEHTSIDHLTNLHQQLLTIEDLEHRYTAYQASFHKLLIEIARRQERQVREDFNAEHGSHLPSDICLYIENPPTRWEVVPFDGDSIETLPDVDNDLLVQAKDAVAREEGHAPGTESPLQTADATGSLPATHLAAYNLFSIITSYCIRFIMMSFFTLATLAAVAGTVEAILYPTQPVQNTVLQAGKTASIRWIDDGKSPQMWESHEMHIELYGGEDAHLGTLASNVDPASLSAEVWITPELASNSSDFYIRFIGKHPSFTVYSSRFTVTGMAGSDSTNISTIPVGALTNPDASGAIPYKTAPIFTIVLPGTTLTSSQLPVQTPTTISAPSLPSHGSEAKSPEQPEKASQRNGVVGRVDMEKLKFRLVFILWPALMGITMAM